MRVSIRRVRVGWRRVTWRLVGRRRIGANASSSERTERTREGHGHEPRATAELRLGGRRESGEHHNEEQSHPKLTALWDRKDSARGLKRFSRLIRH